MSSSNLWKTYQNYGAAGAPFLIMDYQGTEISWATDRDAAERLAGEKAASKPGTTWYVRPAGEPVSYCVQMPSAAPATSLDEGQAAA